MFKKLLSNLAFNPSLIGQVSFYAKRLHNEAAIRRAGFVMLALTMMLQMFAVISPPQSSLQASPNTDLINGGFSNKQEAVNHCRNNTQDYKTILNHFGITCQNVSDATVTSIKPRDNDGKLRSMGRLAYGVEGEAPVRVPGAGTLYSRHFWSLNHDPSYKALKVKDSAGRTVYILFGCGNLVSIGIPTPPPTPVDVCDNIAGVQTNKTECDVCPNKDGIQLKPADCDVCPNKAGIQLKLSECDLCPDKAGNQKKGNCDVCPDKPGVQTTLDECDVCPNVPGVQVTRDLCDVCPDKSGVQTDLNDCDVCPDVPGVQATKDLCDVCPDRPGTQTDESQCKPCEASQTRNDLTACLDYSKKAKNITQGIEDANGSTAKPNDVIEYTLTTTNNGEVTIKDHQVSEGLGDVLDYADVVDLHGGTLDRYNNVTWPKEDIKAKQSAIHKVTVKIKAEIPQTPASSTDPQHYDMLLTNVYGNIVEIKLPQTPVKAVEIATTSLPNTGPGTSLIIGFSLTMIVGYFFARSRLLAKELDIVRADFGAAGGY